MQNFTVHKVPTIDEIDELVGLNILKANFIENLFPPKDKQQHENSDEKPSQQQARIKKGNHTSSQKRKKSIIFLA